MKAFSKKIENLTGAPWLYFAHYNFGRVHGTRRMTPAMAGVTDHLWATDESLSARAGTEIISWAIGKRPVNPLGGFARREGLGATYLCHPAQRMDAVLAGAERAAQLRVSSASRSLPRTAATSESWPT
jgi:hypothetical protein